MSVDFFQKKTAWILCAVVGISVVLGAGLYARFLDRATVQAVSHNFYFLVSDSTHIEVSTHQVVNSGGAGYVLEESEREYVAISVYFSKSQAEIVQSNLSMPSMVLEKTTENLYFKTKKQKQKAKRITGAFSCLKSCIGVLNGEIERLETGATQQSSKRILSDLRRQFAYLAKEYQKDFVSYAFVCEKASAYLLEITDGTVYVGDLRYLLCALCNSFVDLSKEFSL